MPRLGGRGLGRAIGGSIVAHKKPNLPVKTCATCGRPFAWRKKWAKTWDEVRHCSERCRRSKAVRKA
ncbi:DUF2256 domain-containing protein [Nioella halotolerans]|uniref:DUF2256 domain-containing protein n=1 Tax=Nioella halotolerans TaxID=2303578 RepID=UPI003F656119